MYYLLNCSIEECKYESISLHNIYIKVHPLYVLYRLTRKDSVSAIVGSIQTPILLLYTYCQLFAIEHVKIGLSKTRTFTETRTWVDKKRINTLLSFVGLRADQRCVCSSASSQTRVSCELMRVTNDELWWYVHCSFVGDLRMRNKTTLLANERRLMRSNCLWYILL